MVTLTQATRIAKRLSIIFLLIIALEIASIVFILPALGGAVSHSQDPLAVGLDLGAVIVDILILSLIVVEDYFSPFLCDRSPSSRAFTTL